LYKRTAGILHLIGYDHESDDDFKIMTREEERILRAMTAMPSTHSPDQRGVPAAKLAVQTRRRSGKGEVKLG